MYFEAKPHRVVGVNEISYVILPEDSIEELFAMLNDNGIEYRTYISDDEADRLDKLNEISDEVAFSLGKSDFEKISDYDKENYETFKAIIGQYKNGGLSTRDKMLVTKEDGKHDEYHGLTYDEVVQAPILLNNPGMIIDSFGNTDAIIVVSNSFDIKQRPIILIIKSSDNKSGYDLVDFNFLASCMEKTISITLCLRQR